MVYLVIKNVLTKESWVFRSISKLWRVCLRSAISFLLVVVSLALTLIVIFNSLLYNNSNTRLQLKWLKQALSLCIFFIKSASLPADTASIGVSKQTIWRNIVLQWKPHCVIYICRLKLIVPGQYRFNVPNMNILKEHRHSKLLKCLLLLVMAF